MITALKNIPIYMPHWLKGDMKVLFLVPYPTEGASNRVRVEQFLPYLSREGAAYRVRPFMNRRFFRILYEPRRYLEKMAWFGICTVNRVFDLVRAIGYDIVFIHREAYPLGGAFFEYILYRMGKKLIFDFDDTIFLPNTSKENIYIERFKNPDKTAKIIALSSYVIAGNRYLGDFASRFNKNVIIIPSCVDINNYYPRSKGADDKKIFIGWSGSNTTRSFLYDLEDVFEEISRRYDNVTFKFIGANYSSDRVKKVIDKKWSLEDEAGDVQSFDIGIMPMPDNEWTRGKCGFKILLYMACGVPVVSSPVGVNTEIIEDGVNGFLADTKEEWVEKLSGLIEDGPLRRRIGAAGAQTVKERYSVGQCARYFIEVLKSVHNLERS